MTQDTATASHLLSAWSGVRLAIVEDDHRLRGDLVDFFDWRGATAAGVPSAEVFWAGLESGVPPELLLLDLGLPGEDGLSVARRVRQRWPRIGIIMLTAFGSDDHRIDGLDGGADAYLVKGVSLEIVEATCRSVLRRVRSQEALQARDAPWQLDTLQARLQAPSGQTVRLTHMEQLFLSLLMQTPGAAVPRDRLLVRMGKPDTLEQWRNLDGCAARLRRKVAEQGAGELPVRSYYGHGYAFGAPAQVHPQ